VEKKKKRPGSTRYREQPMAMSPTQGGQLKKKNYQSQHRKKNKKNIVIRESGGVRDDHLRDYQGAGGGARKLTGTNATGAKLPAGSVRYMKPRLKKRAAKNMDGTGGKGRPRSVGGD